MKKRFIPFIVLAFASQLYAFQQTDTGSIVVYSDLLYWKLREGGADNWGQQISPSGLHQRIQLLDAPFNWDEGGRVGVGYQTTQCWDVSAYYTHFQTRVNTQVEMTEGGIFSGFLGNFFATNTDGVNFGPNYRAAGMCWSVKYTTVDAELGYKVNVDNVLTLRSFVGIKTAAIHQKMNTSWQNPTTTNTFVFATEDLKNNFFGIGPSVGVNSTWLLCQLGRSSFNFLADVSGALLWGHWRFGDRYQNDTPVSVDVHVSNLDGAATMAKGFMGVEWAKKDRISIRLGYEAQVWFSQLQYYAFNMGRLNNLMSLQGGVFEFQLNF